MIRHLGDCELEEEIASARRPARSGLPSRLIRAIVAYWQRRLERQSTHAMRLALHAFDDRTLKDLGLARSEIDAAVAGLLGGDRAPIGNTDRRACDAGPDGTETSPRGRATQPAAMLRQLQTNMEPRT